MNLHPDDIKELLAKGWGQRHPMAWEGRVASPPVPRTFVMVYAPRGELLTSLTHPGGKGDWEGVGGHERIYVLTGACCAVQTRLI
jgi:hypothetical protein